MLSRCSDKSQKQIRLTFLRIFWTFRNVFMIGFHIWKVSTEASCINIKLNSNDPSGQWGRETLRWGFAYHRWKITTSVPAGPAQAADNIEHLELELWRERRKFWICWTSNATLSSVGEESEFSYKSGSTSNQDHSGSFNTSWHLASKLLLKQGSSYMLIWHLYRQLMFVPQLAKICSSYHRQRILYFHGLAN